MRKPIPTTFDAAFTALIGTEGGFQNDPNDTGNWTSGKIGIGYNRGTNWGISAASYPHLDIRSLTQADARAIYGRDFWHQSGADRVGEALRFALFDTAVNSGVGLAVKLLQRSVGTTDDGSFGPVTQRAVEQLNPYQVVARFCGYRIDLMNNHKKWDRYSKGWSQRVADILMSL